MHNDDQQVGIDPDDEDETTFWRELRAHAETGHLQPTPTSAIDERAEMRRVALTVPCRDCHRDIDEPCVRLDAEGKPTTEPLRKFPAHTSRQNDARKAQR
jgi:hypothetical protein